MKHISRAKTCLQANISANPTRTLGIILILFFICNPAFAWGSLNTGTQLLGVSLNAASHQYILQEAYNNLEKDDPAVFAGSNFPKLIEIMEWEGQELTMTWGTTGKGPDAPQAGTKYSWHEYNPQTGKGEAPAQAANFYQSLESVFSRGIIGKNPAKDAAYLAHYIADVSCPYHVNGMPADDANNLLFAAKSTSDLQLGNPTPVRLQDDQVGHCLEWTGRGMGRSNISDAIIKKFKESNKISDDAFNKLYPLGVPIRGSGGKNKAGTPCENWERELNNWSGIYKDNENADWFDPWYSDGFAVIQTLFSAYILTEQSSTHTWWEWYAYNNYNRPTYPETKVGYSKEFLTIQKDNGNGKPSNIAEFAKEIATNTRKNQKAILDESTMEDTQRDISTELGKAYQEAISDVYTVWRASFCALRPEISLARDPKTGSRKVVVTIENKADEDATDVKVNLNISNATVSGPEGKGLTSSSYDIPEDIDSKFKVIDVWELEEPDPGDASQVKGDIVIDVEVTGRYEKTPDSGRAEAKKIIKDEVANSIILLFDASGSMGDDNKIDNAKVAANSFLTGKVQPEDEVALIVFYDCSSIVVEVPFTTDKSALTSKIDAIEPSGATPIYAAMEFAKDYMNQNARGKDKKIIQFTDGMETCGGDQQ